MNTIKGYIKELAQNRKQAYEIATSKDDHMHAILIPLSEGSQQVLTGAKSDSG